MSESSDQPVAAWTFLANLAQALGLDKRHCRRVVLDAQVCEPILLYIEEYCTDRCSVKVIDVLTGAIQNHPNKVLVVEQGVPKLAIPPQQLNGIAADRTWSEVWKTSTIGTEPSKTG